LRIVGTLVVVLGLLTNASTARADDSLTRLRDTLKREPKAPDVVRMALAYYRVSPVAMQSLRASARARGLLPVLSGFASYNSTGNATAQAQTISNPQNTLINNAGSQTFVTGGLSWDLRELVFNPAEVQTFAVVPMQRDIMLEVVRTFYLRRQLQIRLALKPPADPLALATVELRVEEYTGILDAMTGGSFLRAANAPVEPQ
jgi:hypothetical protein